jgi:zinc protease
MVLYHVPEARSPDTPVLQVMGTLLTGGQSSRLYRRMVDTEQLALAVNGGAGTALDPTTFTFMIQPRSGVDPAATEKALFEELAKLQAAEVPAAELRKAKNQILANLYRQQKTIEGRGLAGVLPCRFRPDY